MDWSLALAAAISIVCVSLAAALTLWSAGAALPDGRRKGLARQIARTAGATSAPSPLMLASLAGVMVLAGLVPWGLAAPPEIGPWRSVFPALGCGFLLVFLSHGAGAWTVRQGTTFARNDRRFFAPLSLALAAGYAVLLAPWFF